MSKILVTSGCSFSEADDPYYVDGEPRNITAISGPTWARYLKEYCSDRQHVNLALSGQGNDIISKRVIHSLDSLLKTVDPKDILVTIMWSGVDRLSIYGNSYAENHRHTVVTNDWHDHQHDKAVVLMFNDVAKYIMTLENILRTQWFLQLHSIPYVMTTYTSRVLPPAHLKTHPEIKYLFNMIDFSDWLPVNGEYEWCKDHSGLPFPVKGDYHPGTEQHKAFFNQIIIPFLKEKQYI